VFYLFILCVFVYVCVCACLCVSVRYLFSKLCAAKNRYTRWQELDQRTDFICCWRRKLIQTAPMILGDSKKLCYFCYCNYCYRNTPLHEAASRRKNWKCVELLLASGFDFNAVNKEGSSFLFEIFYLNICFCSVKRESIVIHTMLCCHSYYAMLS
jgi:hypothetical protein